MDQKDLEGSRSAIETIHGQLKRTKKNLLAIKTIKLIIGFMEQKQGGEEDANAPPPDVEREGSVHTNRQDTAMVHVLKAD